MCSQPQASILQFSATLLAPPKNSAPFIQHFATHLFRLSFQLNLFKARTPHTLTHTLSRSNFQLKIIFDKRSNYLAQSLPFRSTSHANFIEMQKYVYAKRNRSNVRKCNAMQFKHKHFDSQVRQRHKTNKATPIIFQ